MKQSKVGKVREEEERNRWVKGRRLDGGRWSSALLHSAGGGGGEAYFVPVGFRGIPVGGWLVAAEKLMALPLMLRSMYVIYQLRHIPYRHMVCTYVFLTRTLVIFGWPVANRLGL